jgi:lipoprotein signal peptidase
VLSFLLLGIDQGTKTIAQFTLDGRELVAPGGWGLTYIEHDGFWLWTSIPNSLLVVAHAIVLGIWIVAVLGRRWYVRWYRDSVAVDLALAALTVSAFGNLLDRLLVGGARDWWVTPIAVANLADVAIWVVLAAIAWEVSRFPPARELLVSSFRHLDPRHAIPSPIERPRGADGTSVELEPAPGRRRGRG